MGRWHTLFFPVCFTHAVGAALRVVFAGCAITRRAAPSIILRVLRLSSSPVRRYYGRGDLHFITTSCYRRKPPANGSGRAATPTDCTDRCMLRRSYLRLSVPSFLSIGVLRRIIVSLISETPCSRLASIHADLPIATFHTSASRFGTLVTALWHVAAVVLLAEP